MKKRHALFLCHRVPYPPDKGDKIRSWRVLQSMAARYKVHLVSFLDDVHDVRYKNELQDLCASVQLVQLKKGRARVRAIARHLEGRSASFGYFFDQRIDSAVRKARQNKLAVEVAFSSSMAPYIAHHVGDAIRIIDFCDADSAKWHEYSVSATFPLRRILAREACAVAREETEIRRWADHTFAITPAEAALFPQQPELRPVDWWSNGVDADYFSPGPMLAGPFSSDAVFIGAMDYRANIQAVEHFTKDIWPRIRKAKPNAVFSVVGRNPARRIKKLDGRHGVRVIGRVEDVRPWLIGARVSVAPLQVARGLQNKVLEAMAMAKPVVASPEVAVGIRCAPEGELVIAQSPDQWTDAILSLLNYQDRANKIGEAARRRMVTDYQWDSSIKRFTNHLP